MRERENPDFFGAGRRDRPAGHGGPSFDALDPGRDDPGYWARFQDRTLALVEPELARRRQALERMTTVSEVVTSWSRAVVPVAMVAAAAAVMVLLTDPAGSPSDSGPPVGAEVTAAAVVEGSERRDDTLDLAVDGGPIPTVAEIQTDEIPIVVTVAAEAF